MLNVYVGNCILRKVVGALDKRWRYNRFLEIENCDLNRCNFKHVATDGSTSLLSDVGVSIKLAKLNVTTNNRN